MKMQQLAKVVLLLSLLIGGSLYAKNNSNSYEDHKPEQLLLAEELIVAEIRDDIKHLLESKSQAQIANDVFGDCIHFYLSTENDGKSIDSSIIAKNLAKLFNNDFINALDHLKLGDNLTILSQEESIFPNTQQEYIPTIQILIPIDDSEYDSAKVYWFYKKDRIWIFAGLTCIG